MISTPSLLSPTRMTDKIFPHSLSVMWLAHTLGPWLCEWRQMARLSAWQGERGLGARCASMCTAGVLRVTCLRRIRMLCTPAYQQLIGELGVRGCLCTLV